MTEQSSPEPPARQTYVWDRAIRVFHWLLALGFVGLWGSVELGKMAAHGRIGLTVLVLLVVRLMWGIFGSDTARFVQFVRGPRHVWAALMALRRREAHQETGHNPLGALMVIALLGMLMVQATMGLFANDDVLFEGPLASWVGKELSDDFTIWHHRLFDVIKIAVFAHIAAVLYYLWGRRENLIRPMISGYRKTGRVVELRHRAVWVPCLMFVILMVIAHYLMTIYMR